MMEYAIGYKKDGEWYTGTCFAWSDDEAIQKIKDKYQADEVSRRSIYHP